MFLRCINHLLWLRHRLNLFLQLSLLDDVVKYRILLGTFLHVLRRPWLHLLRDARQLRAGGLGASAWAALALVFLLFTLVLLLHHLDDGALTHSDGIILAAMVDMEVVSHHNRGIVIVMLVGHIRGLVLDHWCHIELEGLWGFLLPVLLERVRQGCGQTGFRCLAVHHGGAAHLDTGGGAWDRGSTFLLGEATTVEG
jgi:hypothetical protein